MKAIDPKTAEPFHPNRKQSSFSAVVADLLVGESTIRTSPISGTAKVSTINEAISGWKEQLRNSIQPTIARAKKATGGEYSVEITELITGSGRLFVLGIVTRNK